jgi:putative FmdB family regulatory protein
MPTYEYICEKCGHKFDLFQRISATALKTCPKEQCSQTPWGKGKVKRLIGTGSGIIFKGSGFYITDYRSDSYKSAAAKDAQVSATPAPHKTETTAKPKPASGSKTATAAKAKD